MPCTHTRSSSSSCFSSLSVSLSLSFSPFLSLALSPSSLRVTGSLPDRALCGNSTLLFTRPLERNDSGLYRCEVRNSIGMRYQDTHIWVQGETTPPHTHTHTHTHTHNNTHETHTHTHTHNNTHGRLTHTHIHRPPQYHPCVTFLLSVSVCLCVYVCVYVCVCVCVCVSL